MKFKRYERKNAGSSYCEFYKTIWQHGQNCWKTCENLIQVIFDYDTIEYFCMSLLQIFQKNHFLNFWSPKSYHLMFNIMCIMLSPWQQKVQILWKDCNPHKSSSNLWVAMAIQHSFGLFMEVGSYRSAFAGQLSPTWRSVSFVAKLWTYAIH